jgi:hypothetical protein
MDDKIGLKSVEELEIKEDMKSQTLPQKNILESVI